MQANTHAIGQHSSDSAMGNGNKAIALACRCSFFSTLHVQADTHAIDQCCPDWRDAQGVRMEIKAGKGEHCDPTMGNGTRR